MKDDRLISLNAAIDALWKALYEYEDRTEKQFQESEDLDVGDWIGHRIFVQNMNDIDRQTILNLPSAQHEIIACGDCIHWICHDRRGGYWNHGVKPLDWCCHAERRTDG